MLTCSSVCQELLHAVKTACLCDTCTRGSGCLPLTVAVLPSLHHQVPCMYTFTVLPTSALCLLIFCFDSLWPGHGDNKLINSVCETTGRRAWESGLSWVFMCILVVHTNLTLYTEMGEVTSSGVLRYFH